SSRTRRRSNRKATDARPFTRPDSFASVTVPVTSAPAGTTVTPETTIGLASVPRTGSSTLLVSDATGVRSVMVIDSPAGIVTSRTAGAGAAASGFATRAAVRSDDPDFFGSGAAGGVFACAGGGGVLACASDGGAAAGGLAGSPAFCAGASVDLSPPL